MATPAEYDLVSSALVKLGLPPLQVLLEASVAEVTLTDALNFGLQFYFQAGSQNQFFRTSGTSPTPAPAIETTLSGHSELRIMEDAHAAGFKVNLIFLGIAGPETSLARVRGRVRDGGHDVPNVDIRRRYTRTMTNLGIAIKLADRSFVRDNQGKRRPRLLIVIDGGRMRQVARVLPSWARLVIGPLFGLEEEGDNPR